MGRLKKGKSKKTENGEKKVKKIYEYDGKLFGSTGTRNMYKELKEYLEKGYIKSFSVPTYDTAEYDVRLNALKVMIDEHNFDSMEEAKFYLYALEKKREGIVKEITLQPKFVLQPSFKNKIGHTHRSITYKADFELTLEDDSVMTIDVKGMETDQFKLKYKMFEYKYPDRLLLLVKRVARTKDKWINKDTNEIIL